MAPHPKKNMPYFSIFFITINTNKTTSFRNEYLFRKWISSTFSDENLIKNLKGLIEKNPSFLLIKKIPKTRITRSIT